MCTVWNVCISSVCIAVEPKPAAPISLCNWLGSYPHPSSFTFYKKIYITGATEIYRVTRSMIFLVFGFGMEKQCQGSNFPSKKKKSKMLWRRKRKFPTLFMLVFHKQREGEKVFFLLCILYSFYLFFWFVTVCNELQWLSR